MVDQWIAQSATGSLEEIGSRDHGVTTEYRIFGPPGAGKTTNLTRQIRRAVDRYGTESILVTSFSRGAAAELAGRDLPIAPSRVGTLHSHCWHALGGPEVAESNVSEWNKDHPTLAITPAKKQGKLDGEESGDDDSELEKNGDKALQQLSRFRGLMLGREVWPATLIDFEKRWTEYKRENGLFDFTDSIETCYRNVFAAPRNPSVIFADEAQDLNPCLPCSGGRTRKCSSRSTNTRSDRRLAARTSARGRNAHLPLAGDRLHDCGVRRDGTWSSSTEKNFSTPTGSGTGSERR